LMEITLTAPFGYEPNPEVRRLLEDFRDMVNFCLVRALENKVTSYYRLRKLVYEEWKSKWCYSTHFCHSACRVATSMLKSWRRLKRRGLAKSERPVAKKLFIQLDPQLVKYEGDRLRISVRPRHFITIQLKYGEYQRKFIDEWRAGRLRVGEVTINETRVLIPFRKDVDLSNPKDWIAIDINESNVTGVSSNPHVVRWDAEFGKIRGDYFRKRRRIQQLAKLKPITSRRLMKKYSRRERNKVKDLCHKLSRSIVAFAKEYGLGIVMENLKGIRRRIDYGRKMNRRLHSWSFRRLQFYVEYKAKLEGLPVKYIAPKNTSSLCPVCGGKLAPKGHRRLRCKNCGYENDRDVIGAINILKRGCGEPPLPPKAPNEPLTVEVRGKG